MKQILVIIFSFSLLFSCKNKKQNTHIKTIDSLAVVLKKTDSIYTSIDWNKAIELERTISNDILKIDSLHKKLSKEKQELIDNYNTLKLFGRTDTTQALTNGFDQSQHKKFLRKQIDYSISQLINLKSDIETESLKEDKIKEYIATESAAISELYKFTTLKSEVNKQSISKFELAKPQIDEILNSKK